MGICLIIKILLCDLIHCSPILCTKLKLFHFKDLGIQSVVTNTIGHEFVDTNQFFLVSIISKISSNFMR